MANAENVVLSGDYKGMRCALFKDATGLVDGDCIIPLTKNTVESYEIVDSETMKSGTSTILRAGAGALLLGPVGLLAGVTGKRKGIYTIAIIFKDGKKSLIEVDQKIYKKFVQDMF